MLIVSERSECMTGEKEMGMAALTGDTMGGSAANTERWDDVDARETEEVALGGVALLSAPPVLPPLPPTAAPAASSMSS